MKIFNLFTLSLIFMQLSCDSNIYDHKQMLLMARKGDPQLKIILPSKEYPAINCKKYGDGCMYGVTVKIKRIIMKVIRFETEIEARRSAIRYNTYYVKNWVFDDMKGEPVLVDFVKDIYKAKMAQKEVLNYKETQ